MSVTWILVADSSKARILEDVGGGAAARELSDFANPAGRAADRELTTDAQGRYASKGQLHASHSDSADIGAVDHQIELFAKDLGRYLEKARVERSYTHLWLIAAPKFLGTLRQNITQDVRKLLEGEISKDLVVASIQNIQSQINEKRKADRFQG